MNLHAIVRGPITSIHPDETCELYQASGLVNDRGIIRTQYTGPATVEANWQPQANAIAHNDGMDTTDRTWRVFLYSDEALPVLGITRLPSMRTGDILKRADGTWWAVTSVDGNWSADGWAEVTVTQQTEGIDNG